VRRPRRACARAGSAAAPIVAGGRGPGDGLTAILSKQGPPMATAVSPSAVPAAEPSRGTPDALLGTYKRAPMRIVRGEG
jgi:hypothetical protein